MKKISVLLVVFIFVLTLCSCSGNVKIPTIVTNINNNVVVECGNTTYKCHITRLTDGVVSITINSPENLSGLTFRRTDGKYSISYGELMCKSNSIFLPKDAFPTAIIDILSVIDKQENLLYESSKNNLVTFSGNSKQGSFKLITDDDGNIFQIIQKSSDLKIKFQENQQQN